MPKWKKDETEFEVGVNYVGKRGYSSSILKPVIEALGKSDAIRFVIKGKKVKVERVLANRD